MADEFKFDSPEPWPNLGQVTVQSQSDGTSPSLPVSQAKDTSLGTGMMVAPAVVLTAQHVVSEAHTKKSLFSSVASPSVQLAAVKIHPANGEDNDIVAIECSHPGGEGVSAPVGIQLPEAPVPFRTCGFRRVDGRPVLLWAEGYVLGKDGAGRWQLQTKHNQIREGMSGAPVIIRFRDRPFVIGVIEGRYVASRPLQQEEGLAFAASVEHLPKGILDRIDATDLRTIPTTEHVAAARSVIRIELRRLMSVVRWLMTAFWACTVGALISLLTSIGFSASGRPHWSLALAGVSGVLWVTAFTFRRQTLVPRLTIANNLDALARLNSGRTNSAINQIKNGLSRGLPWT